MDRENTPLKQRQKRGGNNRRSSTSSTASAGKSSQQSTSSSSVAAAGGGTTSSAGANAGGASARAFRGGNTRTRSKTASAVATGAPASTQPSLILAKHPPTILRAPVVSSSGGGAGGYPSGPPAPPQAAAMTGLYDPDAPPMRRSSPPPAQGRYSEGSAPSGGYLQVNTRQQAASSDHQHLYSSAQGRHSIGGGETPVRTLYQPPPSSSPSVKKMSKQQQQSPSTAAAPVPTTLMRPQTTTPASLMSSAHYSNIVAPPTSVKLINAQYQFATDLSSKLSGCLELTNFTVVGVLGFEGMGKSALMSLLHTAHERLPNKQQQQSRESPSPSPSMSRQKKRNDTKHGSSNKPSKSPIFESQDLETLITGDHETTGVDLALSHDPTGATPNSLVLLDTQPMLSSAMLCELLGKNESPRFGALTPEQQVEVHSYQLATFLLSICHYVVIAHDALADLHIVRFLQQIEAKLQNCRLPNISGGVKDKHVAKLLFVANGFPDAALLFKEQRMIARHVQALEKAWPGGFYRTSRQVSLFAQEECESENATPNRQQTPQKIPLFVIPKKPSSTAATCVSNYEDYDDAALRWLKFVQRLPNAPSFSKNPATHHVMNLREWLSNASRVFESVRKSGVFTAEYHSTSRERDHH